MKKISGVLNIPPDKYNDFVHGVFRKVYEITENYTVTIKDDLSRRGLKR